MADLPKRTSVDPATLSRWIKGTFYAGEMRVCVEMLQGALADVSTLQREVLAHQHQLADLHAAGEALYTAALTGPEEARLARRRFLEVLGVQHSGQHVAVQRPDLDLT